jgi:predicted DNA-binding transcriptional regulator
MSKDQVMGLAIFVLSVLGIILYGWFVYGWPLITLQITAFLAVALVLVIAAWIGYTMATTPPPAPLEPIPTSVASEPTSTATDTETKAQDTG